MSTPDPKLHADLTADDLQGAVTLAAELYRKEAERGFAVAAAHELDVPAEYLARAIAMIQQQHIGRQEGARQTGASIRNITIGVLCAVAVAAILWPLALQWRMSLLEVPAPTPPAASPAVQWARDPDITVVGPAKTIGMLPVPKDSFSSLLFRNMGFLLKTKIHFENHLKTPVVLLRIDFYRHVEEARRLQPGSAITLLTHATTPFVVFDEQRHAPIGVYFAQSTLTNAVIDYTDSRLLAGKTAGYLKPASVGRVLPPVSALGVGGNMGTWSQMEFVNLTGTDVHLYCVGAAKRPIWVTHLSGYDNYVAGETQPGALWIVADGKQRILESFLVPPTGWETAVITPDVVMADREGTHP